MNMRREKLLMTCQDSPICDQFVSDSAKTQNLFWINLISLHLLIFFSDFLGLNNQSKKRKSRREAEADPAPPAPVEPSTNDAESAEPNLTGDAENLEDAEMEELPISGTEGIQEMQRVPKSIMMK